MNHVIYPRISEKAFAHASEKNVKSFVVPFDANKHQIKDTVEKQYEVSVTNVNISILKGKKKRFAQRRGRQSLGQRQDVRKAYVTLKQGDIIPVFSGEELESTPPVIATGRKTKKETK